MCLSKDRVVYVLMRCGENVRKQYSQRRVSREKEDCRTPRKEKDDLQRLTVQKNGGKDQGADRYGKKNNRQPIIKIRKAPESRKYFLTSFCSIPFFFIPSPPSLTPPDTIRE